MDDPGRDRGRGGDPGRRPAAPGRADASEEGGAAGGAAGGPGGADPDPDGASRSGGTSSAAERRVAWIRRLNGNGLRSASGRRPRRARTDPSRDGEGLRGVPRGPSGRRPSGDPAAGGAEIPSRKGSGIVAVGALPGRAG